MDNPRSFETLVGIMRRLRAPDGCPWDREQTYQTLRGYLLEECYEAVEALDAGDASALREELGDLLFQVVFLARLADEEGAFDAGDVVEGIARKMVRRHPHVFGDDVVDSSDEVLRKWEQIKKREKGERAVEATSFLDGLPRVLPALLRAQRLGEKAARVGFDWKSAEEVVDKVAEEFAELRRALGEGRRDAIADELGDILFALAMLGRHLRIDPEAALEAANAKFRRRFRAMEEALERDQVPIETAGPEMLERLWADAKASDQAAGGEDTRPIRRKRS